MRTFQLKAMSRVGRNIGQGRFDFGFEVTWSVLTRQVYDTQAKPLSHPMTIPPLSLSLQRAIPSAVFLMTLP